MNNTKGKKIAKTIKRFTIQNITTKKDEKMT